ncbi:hypothetical protein SK128_000358 [Halocaridina rubra]|uniref:Palmitoyltransferase n=1 Tax=Halocaridina rubra TaxID=373956 RepID=A0AAN8X8N4_HALRR
MQVKSMYIFPKAHDDSALCCCEYINEDGERSHILAAFCDCEAIDEAFERLVTWKPVEGQTYQKMMMTLADRLRIPWRGGAKQVPLDVCCAFSLFPVILLLGCISWLMSFISYLLILPVVIFSIHRFFRKARVLEEPFISGSDRAKHGGRYPRTQFFLAWLMISVISLIFVYYTQVITYLKISPYENLLLMIFICIACTSLYIVKVTSYAGFEPRVLDDEGMYGEAIESGAWQICIECAKQVPRMASHCRTCDSCYLLRDHHCIWLDTCISTVNDRWFVIGLLFSLSSLAYGSLLSLTTVCHPRLVDMYFTIVLLPHQCPDAFSTFQ